MTISDLKKVKEFIIMFAQCDIRHEVEDYINLWNQMFPNDIIKE